MNPYKPSLTSSFALLTLTLGLAAALAFEASANTTTTATVGQPAPAFTATDTSGKRVSLADFKGKHVVLEWVNDGQVRLA